MSTSRSSTTATGADRVVLPLHVKPIHYNLELHPDLLTLKFGGILTIDSVVFAETNEIHLHAKEISIKSARFSSSTGKSHTLSEITYKLSETVVVLRFDSYIEVGNGVLSIEYDGILNGDMAGFYKSNYTDVDGSKQLMASTQFEPLDARRALPCWDEPAVKATFSVIIVCNADLTAISNMPEVSTTHLSGGKKKVIFDKSPKMSTYLLAWAVGKFDYLQGTTNHGVKIRVFCPPGRAEHGKFALDAGCRALDFYDDFFKLPYPLPKLDMICCTEFAMGAMENWGLVTYREVDLMIDEVKASSQQKQRVAIVVAHELAHQWFGNLVTMEWWEDIWLNEGFAAYMENFCVDALYPGYKIWEKYITDAYTAAQRLDSLRSSHPIQVPMVRAEEVEQVFDAISYCKGSTVVRMVEAILGSTKFREGLQNYMQKFQYGNTITTDLWQAWSDASGIDIPGVMATWTSQMGHPYVKVVSEVWEADSVTVTLEQNWFLADGSGEQSEEDKAKIWSIPLLFATSLSESESAELMTVKRQTFKIPISGERDWLKINFGQKALLRVSYSQSMINRLKAAVASKIIGPIDRVSLLLDAYALAKAGLGSLESLVDLLKAYYDEDNDTVWDAIRGVLAGLHLLLEQVGGDVFEAFKTFGAKMVLRAFHKVGWETKSSDGHSERLFRSTIISLLDTFGDKVIDSDAKKLYDDHWEHPNVISSDFKTTIYKIVLKNGGLKEYEEVLKTFYSTSDNAERKFAMNSLGATADLELKRRTLDWAIKGDVKLQDFFYPIGSVASSQRGCQLAWKYFKENFSFIEEKLAKASPSLMDAVIVNSTLRFCTLDDAAEVEDFFSSHPLPKSERRIKQLVESIRINGSLQLKIQQSQLIDPSFWN